MIDIKDEHGRCPIHCAAIFANVEAVKVLLKANSNPNQVKVQMNFYQKWIVPLNTDKADDLGMTPLHYAAENPSGVKVAEILLNRKGT